MQAAVIIPHYNDVKRLEKCLAALEPQVADQPIEVVVADNGSSQDLSPIRARFPWVSITHEANPGAAAARNRGVAATSAQLLFFTDADCVPAPDWIATAFQLAGDADRVGGRVDVFDETPPPRSGAEAFEAVFAFPQRTYIERKHYSVTANMLTTRAVFDDVGPFDGSRTEDYDWGMRAQEKGYGIVYRDTLVVEHPTRQDWASLRKKWRRSTSENYFLNGTTARDRVLWAARSVAMLGSIVVHAPRVLAHPDLSPLEKARGLVMLARVRGLRTIWMLQEALFDEPPMNQPKSSSGLVKEGQNS